MASYKFRVFFFAALVLALSASASVRAQGNDFAFYPGVPPQVQPFVPSPVPGLDFNWGATVPGSYQKLWGVKRGSTLKVDFVLDWYGLGPLSASIMSNSAGDIRYMEGSNPPKSRQWVQPGVGYFCLRCSWEIDVIEDDPDIWIAFMGSERFGAHLEITEILPPKFASIFNVLRPDDKQTSANIGNALKGAAGFWNGLATGFAVIGDGKWTAIFAAMGYIGNGAGDIYIQWARDPWDGDYCSAVGYEDDQQAINDLRWTWDYTGDSNTYLSYSGVVIKSAGKAAQTAIDRALSAAQAVEWDGNAEGCAWERRAEALAYIRMVGDWMWNFRWSIEATANAYQGQDYPGDQFLNDSMRVFLDTLAYSASWSQGVQ